MSLMPDQNWKWFYHADLDRLAIQLGESMAFATEYTGKQIIPDGHYELAFSTAHADYYLKCLQKVEQDLRVSEGQGVQIALNLTAARFFSLPMMPKSWHFSVSEQIVFAKEGKLVSLQTKMGKHHFIVVEANDQTALLMLVEPECELTNGKSLAQFGLIKVMSDRLMPAMVNRQLRVVAA